MTESIPGFIGVGSLAEYTIEGLRRGGYDGRILLSPRNRECARRLAQQFQCEVMNDNQSVVDSSDYLILSTRPTHCHAALADLKLKPGMLVVSVVAGVSIDSLQAVTESDIQIVRAMPVNCAKACASPTLIYPDHKTVTRLFDYCGKAIVVQEEAFFEQGSVIACVYTWFFALFEQLIESTSGPALPRELSTELVLGMAKGAASLALQNQSITPGEIATSIATEGTYSKQGLDLLIEQKAFEPWNQACQLLLDGLSRSADKATTGSRT